MINQIPLAVCAFIIRDDKKILAITRKGKDSLFGLPGGKVDNTDLNASAAICRELREETGLTNFGPPLPVFTHMCWGSVAYLTTTFMFSGSLDEKLKNRDGEGKMAWVTPNHLSSPDYSPFWNYNKSLFSSLGIGLLSHRIDDPEFI